MNLTAMTDLVTAPLSALWRRDTSPPAPDAPVAHGVEHSVEPSSVAARTRRAATDAGAAIAARWDAVASSMPRPSLTQMRAQASAWMPGTQAPAWQPRGDLYRLDGAYNAPACTTLQFLTPDEAFDRRDSTAHRPLWTLQGCDADAMTQTARALEAHCGAEFLFPMWRSPEGWPIVGEVGPVSVATGGLSLHTYRETVRHVLPSPSGLSGASFVNGLACIRTQALAVAQAQAQHAGDGWVQGLPAAGGVLAGALATWLLARGLARPARPTVRPAPAPRAAALEAEPRPAGSPMLDAAAMPAHARTPSRASSDSSASVASEAPEDAARTPQALEPLLAQMHGGEAEGPRLRDEDDQAAYAWWPAEAPASSRPTTRASTRASSLAPYPESPIEAPTARSSRAPSAMPGDGPEAHPLALELQAVASQPGTRAPSLAPELA